MTAYSPELLNASAEAVATRGISRSAELQTFADCSLLLARLGCLIPLANAQPELKQQLENAVREELLKAFSVRRPARMLALWGSFSTFSRHLMREFDSLWRDRVQVEFVLSQVTLQQIFETGSSWQKLYALGLARLQDVMNSRWGGSSEVSQMVEQIYREQRRSLGKELFVRFLPSVVLLLASVVAIFMALLFTRSLVSG